jgi:hypothetical protein
MNEGRKVYRGKLASVVFAISIVCSSAEPTTDLQAGHDLVRLKHFEAGRAVYAKLTTNDSAVVRSVARLAIAQSFVLEGRLAEARAEYSMIPGDAPAHHQWEAKERVRQLERREKGLPARDPAGSRVQLPALPPATISLHVAPQGSDANPGTAGKPFASLERARDEIRAIRQTNAMRGVVEVLVHGGEYQISRTLTLDSEDSGREHAPVVYRAVRGEKPVFRGGVRLDGFTAVTAKPLLDRLPEESRSRVRQLDLAKVGVTKLIPLKLGGFASGHGFKTHPAHELFFNGKAMQLARGPNEGFLRVKEVAVKDRTKGYDREGSKVGKFVFEGERPLKWVNEQDLLLYGYWFWDWADSYERVAGIDAENRTITLAEPFHNYGYSIGAPYYAINALSELDAAGEWYLDRKEGVLIFYPPGEVEKAVVELSMFGERMLELKDVRHVRFEGLTWELGSADAIRVVGGRDVLFAGCTVRQFAGNGIEITGGERHGILSSDIYSMGRGGTLISGGNRKTLKAGGHFIENCEVYDLSRIDHTYTPAVILNGVGNRIAHNRFHEIPSSAMRIEGNDHMIEFNEIFHVVQESDDQGGADMFGNPTYRGNVFRFNTWHHIGKWDGRGEQPKCGQAGIRLDDAISGTLVYGNIFERCSSGKVGFGGVQIHGGKDNIIDNNLFIACRAAVSFTAWSEDRWEKFVRDALQSPHIDRDLYLQRYPEIGKFESKANENHLWRNRSLITKEMFLRAPGNLATIDNSELDCCDPSDEMPGFFRIPHEEIGLYRDGFRKNVGPTRKP